ncbi:MAG: hypothetical protein DWQ19_10175 [Crenarchaeota archaeon]|mgnify:CR=1 FL=1|nr:MAG: hypothetical protein DWQ19_10175 [Thermoproteota archaeon]
MLFLLACVICASPDYEGLINQLGDYEYVERVHAANQLYKHSSESIPYLKKACNHPDPEIKYSSRNILLKIRHVLPSKKFGVTPDMPSIWYLPPGLRYKNGEDLSLKYYNKVYSQAYKEMINYIPLEIPLSLMELRSRKEERERREYYSHLVKEFFGWDVYLVAYTMNSKLAEWWATYEYIGDMREKGMSHEDAVAVLDQMIWNSEHTVFYNSQKHFTPKLPPSIMLPKGCLENLIIFETIYYSLKARIRLIQFNSLINFPFERAQVN